MAEQISHQDVPVCFRSPKNEAREARTCYLFIYFYREKELLTRLNVNYTLIKVIYVCFCVSLVSLSVVMSRTLFSALHSLILMHK